MKSIFLPSVSLMDRLMYPQKLFIIGLLIIFPFLSGLGYVNYQVKESIERIRAEKKAVQYAAESMRLLIHVQEHRGLMTLYLNGNRDVFGKIQQVRKQIEQDIQTVRTLAEQTDNRVILSSEESLNRYWKLITEDRQPLRVEESLHLHNDLIANILSFKNYIFSYYHVAGLEKDNQYIAVDLLLDRIPDLLVKVGQIRIKTLEAVSAGGMTPADKMYLSILVGEMEALDEKVHQETPKVSYAFPSYRQEVQAAYKNMHAATVNFTKNMEEKIITPAAAKMDIDTLFALSQGVTDRSYAMYDFLARSAEAELTNKENRLTRNFLFLLALSFVLLLSVLYLFIGFYLSVKRTVSNLRETAELVAGGELGASVRLSTKDELAVVGDAFNQLISTFNRILGSFKQNNRKLQESLKAQERLAFAMENAPVGISLMDLTQPGGAIIYVNQGFTNLTGYTKEEVLGGNYEFLCGAKTSLKTIEEIDRAVMERRSFCGDILNYRKDGQEFWNQISVHPIFDTSGELLAYVGFHQDVTEQRRSERVVGNIAKLLSAEIGQSFFASLVQGLAKELGVTGVLIVELDEQKENLTTVAVSYKGEIQDNFTYSLRDTPSEKVIINGVCCYAEEIQAQFPQDRWLQEWGIESYIGIPLTDASGRVIGVLLALDDKPLSEPKFKQSVLEIFGIRAAGELERKKHEENIHHMAYHEPLTNLPNRRYLDRHLQKIMKEAQKDGEAFAVMVLKVDRFDRIVQQTGHMHGERLIQKIAERCRNYIQDGSMLAYLGGEKFVVILNGISDIREAGLEANRLLSAFAKPFYIGRHDYYISARIGIGLYPSAVEQAEELLRNAEMALYEAQMNEEKFRVYVPGRDSLTERIELESGLHKALEQEQFMLFYQPKVEAQTGRVAGFEALLRWKHPQKGMISPAAFIPLAEETGLITSLGDWALWTACRQNKAWQAAGHSMHPIAVNISALQFRQSDFVERIAHILFETDVPPPLLELELTESVIQNHEQAVEKMAQLKQLGVRISLDDFGTGYSSLGYLPSLPVDALKIDQSFVRNMEKEPRNREIIKAIIGLGHSLNMKTVAEGVETETAAEWLRREGCDEMQGYYFSRPVPASEAIAFLEGNK